MKTYRGYLEAQNGSEYRVEFQVPGSGTVDITLGGTPCIIEQASEGLFSPIKSRSATISVVSDKYLFDLYSSGATDIEVRIYKDDDSLAYFSGYVTPCAYSQRYEGLDTIDIECVEAISALKYIDYTPVGTEKGIVSFYEVFKHCLAQVGYETQLIAFDSTKISSSDDGAILKQLSINEANFFDDDEDATPWKMYEVLEELCKYLGMTLLIDEEETPLLIDYAMVDAGDYSVMIYDLEDDLVESDWYDDAFTITGDAYRERGASLSIEPVCNKVTINVNTYSPDTILPKPFDDLKWVQKPWLYDDDGEDAESDIAAYYNDDDNTTKYWLKNYSPHFKRNAYLWNGTFSQLTDDSVLNSLERFAYASLTNAMPYDPPRWLRAQFAMQSVDSSVPSYHGCSVFKAADVNTKEMTAQVNFSNYMVISNGLPSYSYWRSHIQSGGSIENYLTWVDARIGDSVNLPVAEFVTDVPLTFSSDSQPYLVINGEALASPIPAFATDSDTDDIAKAIFGEYMIDEVASETPISHASNARTGVRLRISIGNKYWDNANRQWVTNSGKYFYIPIDEAVQEDNLTMHQVKANKWYQLRNIIEYTDGLNTDGWAIPIDTSLSGKIKIELFASNWQDFRRATVAFSGGYSTVRYTILKDLSFSLETAKKVWYADDSEEKDVTYSNDVEGSTAIDEYDDIELKVNTQVDGKPQSVSSVINTEDMSMNKTLFNTVTGENQMQELNLVDKYINHYGEPKIRLQLSVSEGDVYPMTKVTYAMPNGSSTETHTFVVDSIAHDLRESLIKVNLVEL